MQALLTLNEDTDSIDEDLMKFARDHDPDLVAVLLIQIIRYLKEASKK